MKWGGRCLVSCGITHGRLRESGFPCRGARRHPPYCFILIRAVRIKISVCYRARGPSLARGPATTLLGLQLPLGLGLAPVISPPALRGWSLPASTWPESRQLSPSAGHHRTDPRGFSARFPGTVGPRPPPGQSGRPVVFLDRTTLLPSKRSQSLRLPLPVPVLSPTHSLHLQKTQASLQVLNFLASLGRNGESMRFGARRTPSPSWILLPTTKSLPTGRAPLPRPPMRGADTIPSCFQD